MSFPFRFYGRKPSSWTDGRTDGHLYEIQFRAEPTAAQKDALAERFERHFASGPARPEPAPWLWSRRFARFAIGDRWVVSSHQTFARVGAFVQAAHGVAPIEDVLFWGRQGTSRGRWDTWSQARQALPDPGPTYPDGPGPRGVDASLPVAAPDDAFEAARERARKDVRADTLATTNADSGIQVVEIDADAHPRPELPEAARRAVGEPDLVRDDERRIVSGNLAVLAEPRIVGRTWADKELVGLCFVADDGTLRQVELPDGVTLNQHAGGRVAVHADGDRGVYDVYGTLYEVDFATGKSSLLWESPDGILALGYLGDEVLVRTHTALVVLDLSGASPAVLTQARRKGSVSCSLEILRHDTVILVRDDDSTGIYGYAAGKLKKLSEPRVRMAWAWMHGGDVLLSAYGGDGRQVYRLEHLDETVEAWARPLREKADEQRRKAQPPDGGGASGAGAAVPATKTRTKLELEPAETLPPEPPRPSVDEATRKKLGRGELTPDGKHGLVPGEPVVILDVASGEASNYHTPNGGHGDPVQMRMPDADTLVVRFGPSGWARKAKDKNKGLRVEVARRTKKGWTADSHVEIKKTTDMAAHGNVVAVLTSASTRLVLFGIGDGELVKLGAFKEAIEAARFDASGRLFVQDSREQVYEVAGLAEVAEKKLAAAAKKKKR